MAKFLVGLLLSLLCASAFAQVPDPDRAFAASLAAWTRTLDLAQREARLPATAGDRLRDLRSEADSVRATASAAAQAASNEAGQQQGLIDALGPAPTAEQPKEAATVAAQRAKLASDLSRIQGRQRQAEFIAARAQSVADEIATAERRQLTEQLLDRGLSPVDPSLWQAAGQQFGAFLVALGDAPGEWWHNVADTRAGRTAALTAAVVLVLILLIMLPARSWLLRRAGVDPTITEPDRARVLLASIVEALGRAILPAVCTIAVLIVLDVNGLVAGLFGAVLRAITFAFVAYVLVTGLAQTAFLPDHPNWRPIHLTEESAKRVVHRFHMLGAALVLANLLNVLAWGRFSGDDEMQVLHHAVSGCAFAVVLLSLGGRTLWRIDPAAKGGLPVGPGAARFARILAWATLPPALVALLLGYDDLAEYVIRGMLFSGLISGLYLIVRGAARDSMNLLLHSTNPRLSSLRDRLAVTGEQTGLRFWLGFVFEALALALYLLALAGAWRVPTDTLVEWLRRATDGIKIGGITLSLGNIAAAIAFFILGLIITRFVQSALRDRVLPQTRLDIGVRHSITAGVGYIGFVLAALVAISAIGLNLANVALIAGALSVGIGFGLQNIVNNFVSGLILLIERPVKVGDWVVVGQHEGYVRRISVRATEIETFPRASVIVPNSELLSGAVTNWTHRDRMGRFDVTVNVAYGSDVAKVKEVLLACVATVPGLLKYPAPYIIFRDFGPSALVFNVRGYISDVEHRLSVESDLRYALYEAMLKEGVGMPYAVTASTAPKPAVPLA